MFYLYKLMILVVSSIGFIFEDCDFSSGNKSFVEGDICIYSLDRDEMGIWLDEKGINERSCQGNQRKVAGKKINLRVYSLIRNSDEMLTMNVIW